MTDRKTMEDIEQYLLGEMQGGVLEAFELRLKNEPTLAAEVAEYREVLQVMKEYHVEEAFRAQLDRVHSQLDFSNARKLVPTRRRTKGIRQVLGTAAVAAGLALLVMLAVGRWIIGGSEPDTGLVDLKGEMDRLNEKMDSVFYEQNVDVKDLDVSFGTAFPITSNGYLVTSHHTVKDAERVFVELPGSSRYQAQIVYSDPAKDLAVLQTADTNFTTFGTIPYSFGSKSSRLGEYVYTLGYSKQNVVFTEGSISSLTGFEEDTFAYQISVPANPGNSGGPLISSDGSILGLISGKDTEQEGAAFAIKSTYIVDMLKDMQADTSFADLRLPRNTSLRWSKRPTQIEKLKDYVLKVRVFSK